MLSFDQITVVYYHQNCSDGMVAAFAIWRHLPVKDKVEFVPVQHGYNPPSGVGKGILIVDFSFPKNVTERLITETEGKLLIIDHHDSAQRALNDIPDEYKIFVMNHCAAVLTWDWISKYISYPMTKLLAYIEARDLWKVDSPLDWKSFHFGLNAETLTFERLQAIYEGELTIDQILHIGTILKKDFDDRVNKSVEKMVFRLVENPLEPGMIVIAVGNIINDTSDVGNAVLQKYPFVDVYASYYIDTALQETQYSFRSRGYPTNKLGEYFRDHKDAKNAGGHPKASGCRFRSIITELPLKIISRKKINQLVRGNKVVMCSDEVDSQKLKDLFPDLVTIVPSEYLIIRGDQVVRDTTQVLKSDIVVRMKAAFGKALLVEHDGEIKDLPW